jgi:hypothetical protein
MAYYYISSLEIPSLRNLVAELLELEPRRSVVINTGCNYALVTGAVMAHLRSYCRSIITASQAKSSFSRQSYLCSIQPSSGD